jgi:exonuclease VII small subunit
MPPLLNTTAELKQVFETQSLRNVAIIDDAYIVKPTRAVFERDNRLAVLVTNIQKWEHPIPEFQEFVDKLESDDILTDKVIQELYARRGESADIAKWFEEFEQEQKSNKSLLDQLELILSDDLKCDVQQLTPDQDFDAKRLPELIFVDYFLDPGDRVEHSLELAGRIGERIAASYKGEKPLVVLMSSKHSIDALKKSNFIEKAGLLGGLFHFVPKAELKRTPTFFIKLAILVRSKQDGKRVQDFIEELDKGVANSVQEFRRTISALSLEDYGYMQQLSLQGEGMALGDYLLWLFGTYFSGSLMKAASKQKAAMDQMVFSKMPDAEGAPSKDFVDLFALAVSEEVPELGTHPRSTITNASGVSWSAPDPHFGDIFIDNGTTKAFMIVTPECDLIYAPEIEAKRPADSEKAILMIPGTISENSGFTHSCIGIQTSLVQVGTKRYLIDWELKRARIAPMGTLRQFMDDRQMKRKVRLKHPFSAWVQMAYLSDAVRVPVPVGPPVVDPVGATIHFVVKGERQRVELPGSPAVTYVNRDGEPHVRPKLSLVEALLRIAGNIYDDLEARIQTFEEGSNDAKRFRSQLDGMKELLTKLDAQQRLLEPFAFTSGVKTFGSISTEFVKDGSKVDLNKMLTKAITVHIHPTESEIVASKPDDRK